MKILSFLLIGGLMVAKLWSLQAYASETSNQSDWTGWRGPDQTNISPDTGLLKSWPKGGPKLLWTYEDAGSGYSSAGDRRREVIHARR